MEKNSLTLNFFKFLIWEKKTNYIQYKNKKDKLADCPLMLWLDVCDNSGDCPKARPGCSRTLLLLDRRCLGEESLVRETSKTLAVGGKGGGVEAKVEVEDEIFAQALHSLLRLV